MPVLLGRWLSKGVPFGLEVRTHALGMEEATGQPRTIKVLAHWTSSQQGTQFPVQPWNAGALCYSTGA